jgi:hypothetical protein
MSQFLHMQQFSLGRNARMLAAHAMERVGEYNQVITKVVQLDFQHAMKRWENRKPLSSHVTQTRKDKCEIAILCVCVYVCVVL